MTRKRMNLLLTAALLAVCFVIGGVTMITHFTELGYAALVTYKQMLPSEENKGMLNGAFDGITARIKAFDQAASTHLFQKKNLQKLNMNLQLGLGKRMLSAGGSTMVTCEGGYLYDLVEDTDATRAVRDTTISGYIKLNEKLKAQGIPMLYGYAHTTLYQDGMLPSGIVDDNNAVADDIVKRLSDAGIPVIDSRAMMRESGLPLSDMIYRTDAHWSVRTAFEMYARMVDLLNEKTAIKADRDAANIENFDINVLKRAHISDLGNLLGADRATPDDFALITPKFQTNIHREISKDKQMLASDGAFEDVVLDKSELPEAKGVPYTNCYNYYGQHTDVIVYHNESAPEGRLLVVKDSYGAPTSSFLSLAVRDVFAVDLRKNLNKTVEDYVAEFKPDAVIILQCQEAMRGSNFVFVNE